MSQAPRVATWIAVVMAAPAIASALALTAIESYRIIEPQAELFGGPPPASLAQAILDGYGVEQAYQFIRAGHDPNQLLAVTHREYTENVQVNASPLLLAVARSDGSTVAMLLAFGARLDLPQNRHVECLARELRDPEVVMLIVDRRGESAPPSCAARKPAAPTPLLAWAD